MKVYGFGEKKTPEAFANACSKFTYLEALGAATVSEGAGTTARKDAKELRGDARLVQLLRSAVDSATDDDGWRTWARSANRWPTRRRSTRATTATASSAISSAPPICSNSARPTR